MRDDFGAMQDYQDFARFASRYHELTADERDTICFDHLGEPHEPSATQGEACVLWEEWKRGNIETEALLPYFGPREYVLIVHVERKATVKALCQGDAMKLADSVKEWDVEDCSIVSAVRKLPKPRCQMHIFVDDDLDVDSHFEFAEDKRAARKHGMVGYYLEVATTIDGNGDPIWTNTDCDSCSGFIKTKDVLDAMFEQAELPPGIAREDVEIYFEGNQA